jgi:integrase/recombinase XerD
MDAYGLVDHGIQIDQLRPTHCPNCNNANKPDARFCVKCCLVLSYDAYEETLKEQEKQKMDMDKLQEGLKKLDAVFAKFTEQDRPT